jgi:hypothetical protein
MTFSRQKSVGQQRLELGNPAATDGRSRPEAVNDRFRRSQVGISIRTWL